MGPSGGPILSSVRRLLAITNVSNLDVQVLREGKLDGAFVTDHFED